jgi:cytochrome b-561
VGYLGEPSWNMKNEDRAKAVEGYSQPMNVLAWHPLFMVAGFFWSQAIAISSWSVLPSYKTALAVHIFFQLAAVTTLICGLCAIAAYKRRVAGTESSLTTMHSWAGIVTVVMFGTQFLIGCAHSIINSSGNQLVISTRNLHKSFGVATFASTAITIVSGIMNYTNKYANSCQYVQHGDWKYIAKVETDPARHYNWLPNACKIANGLGIAVIVTVFAIVYAVSLRTPFPEETGVSKGEDATSENKKTVDEETRA